MNYFTAVLVCAFLAVALGAPNVDKEKVKQSLQRLKEAHVACNKDASTNVDLEAVKKAQQENTPEPANLGAHALCVSKKVGWQNDDGTVNAETLRAKIKEMLGDRPDLDNAISEGLKPAETPEATAMKLFNNYKKYLPRPNETKGRDN